MPVLATTIEDLVFFDESHFHSEDMWKNIGWFFKGAPSPAYKEGIGESLSLILLLAIGWNGPVNHFIHVHNSDKSKKESKSTGVDALKFVRFLVETHQNTHISKIFIMDNAKIHTTDAVKDVIKGMQEDGRKIVCQAKYSPDTNPIELVFGVIKRRAKNTTQVPKDLAKEVHSLIRKLRHDQTCQHTIQKVYGGFVHANNQ